MADPHDTPGEPPQIRDEAADSPMWLPVLGLTLLILGALVIAWRSGTTDVVDDVVDEAAEEAAPGDADEANEDEADSPE